MNRYIQQYVRGLMDDYQIGKEPDKQFKDYEIIKIIDQVKSIIVNDIDDIYLDKLLLEKQKHPINRNNARLMSVALFLQMLGLILVLSRDLRKE